MLLKRILYPPLSLCRILKLSGEEVEETEIDGFVDDEQTYYSGNVCDKKIVQVQYVVLNVPLSRLDPCSCSVSIAV